MSICLNDPQPQGTQVPTKLALAFSLDTRMVAPESKEGRCHEEQEENKENDDQESSRKVCRCCRSAYHVLARRSSKPVVISVFTKAGYGLSWLARAERPGITPERLRGRFKAD